MRLIVGIVLGLAFAGVMAWAVMQESKVQCEVCLDYGGQRLCRTGSGLDRKRAVENYLDLLKSGGDDYPMEQLEKAGVDLTKQETFQAVIEHMDDLVTLLEKEMEKL